MRKLNISFVKFGLKILATAIFLLAIVTQGCKKNAFSYQEPVRQVLAYDMMKEDTSLSIWVQALDKANMSPTLNTYGPFTIFAPDNNAFRKYFAGKGKTGLDNFTAEELYTLLVYHILPTRLKSGEFTQGPQPVATGMGDFISLDISRGYKENTIVNSIARLYRTDIEYSNAILHKMDAVLTPPTLSIGQFLEQNKDRYSIMIAGLKRAKLWDTLTTLTDGGGNRIRLTLFAEPDDVLKAAGIQDFDNMPFDQLDTLMRYHMIAGANFSASYTHKTDANVTIGLGERWDSTIVTLNKRQWIYFDLAADKLINGIANFAASDVIMRNGTLQVLDKHIAWNQGIKRTQIYHWFRMATNWAYGLPNIGSSQAPAINGSGRWRTFGENGREFLFFDPDGINDSCVTIVKNIRVGKYRINVSYKAGGRGTYQLKCGEDPIGGPTALGQSIGTVNAGLYNQKLSLGVYEFKTTGDQRLNFVTTVLPGVAFDNLVLTPEY
jgi:uncharacterized surface protein with fasciclin (FAS1) repeats